MYVKTTEAEEEIVHDPFTLDMEFISAIRMIQRNDRGRQYRNRLKTAKKTLEEQDAGRGKGGRGPGMPETEAAIKVQ